MINAYIKYNPADESTFPKEEMPVLCAIYDRKHKDWGVDAGYFDSFSSWIWNERFKEADIYWQPVIIPGNAQPTPKTKQFVDAIAGGKEEAQ